VGIAHPEFPSLEIVYIMQKQQGRVGHVVTIFTLVAVELAMIGLSRQI